MRSRWALCALAVLVCAPVALAMMDTRPAQTRAKQWVADHRGVLPQTLEQFAAYPVEYRREILKALPAEDQSRLWRAQLRFFLETHPRLTLAQRSFVDYAIDITRPESFQPLAHPPELCAQVAKLFPDSEERKYLTKLGTVIPPAFGWRSAAVTLTERIHTKLTLKAAAQDCECAGLGICDCGIFSSCVNGSCNPVDSCGCIFVTTCTNVCQFILASPVKK